MTQPVAAEATARWRFVLNMMNFKLKMTNCVLKNMILMLIERPRRLHGGVHTSRGTRLMLFALYIHAGD